MQIAQRVLLAMTVVILLMMGMVVIYREKEEKLLNQWEHVQTERFLKKICRNERLSWDEYMYYDMILNYRGNISEIRIEEYRKEQDMEGNNYYFLVSWEELQEYFGKEDIWTFEPDSIIRIEVDRRSKGNSVSNGYYGIVSGKE